MRFFLSALALVFCVEVNASPRPNQHRPQPNICNTCQNHPATGQNHSPGTNTNGNTNGNSNGNSNGNTNNNTNTNSNSNTSSNRNSNTSSNKINVNATATGGSSSASTGSSSSSASGGNTTINTPAFPTNYGNPGPSYNYSPSFTDGRSFSPSFGGPSYSPGFSSPSYGSSGGGGFSGGSVPVGGFGGGFAAVEPIVNNQADNPATAWLTVDLPHENSDVYLNGVKMPQKGITRKYVTPPLNKQATYHYALKVVWPDLLGGKRVYNANIELKAGDEIRHTVPGALNGLPPMPNQGPVPPKKEKIEDEETKIKATEKRIQSRLNFAKEMFDAGKPDKGKKWLEDIITEYPESKGAEEAKNLLSKIK